MKRAGLVAALVVLFSAAHAQAYLKLGTTINGKVISLKWDTFPIRYFISNHGVPGVQATDLRDAVGRAFASWKAIPNTSISSQFAGFTQASSLGDDNMTVIGFANRPDLDRVLGSTSFTVDIVSGEIVDADIFLNSSFAWSVAPGGDPGAYDVESIALHEIGHLHGLGHSALGETQLMGGSNRLVLAAEATMFPVAFSAGSVNARTPRADDIAGISDLYGTSAFRQSTGSISGRVTRDGVGLFGAHVIAFSPQTGKLVAGFTLDDDGSFIIAGLDPGPQVIRAEPLDDADPDSFFDTTVDVDFKPAFSARLVVVPEGGTANDVEVKVVSK